MGMACAQVGWPSGQTAGVGGFAMLYEEVTPDSARG